MAEFASKGVAGAGLGLGIAGTALDLLNGGAGLLTGMGNMASYGCAANTNAYVNRYELGMAQDLASKDGRIAILESEKYTDEKHHSEVLSAGVTAMLKNAKEMNSPCYETLSKVWTHVKARQDGYRAWIEHMHERIKN